MQSQDHITPEAFRTTLRDDAPPTDLSAPLLALWWQGKNDWERAHEAAQSDDGVEAAWVHAHLHRVEGDNANAGYWYRRAGQPVCAAPLDEEWSEILRALLR
jgi:hypothetical protein